MNSGHGLPLDGEILPPVGKQSGGLSAFVPKAHPAPSSSGTGPSPDLSYFQPAAPKRAPLPVFSSLALIVAIAIACGAGLAGRSSSRNIASGSSVYVVQLKSRVQMRGAIGRLFVDGMLRNGSNAHQALPPLRVRVISRAGNVQFFPFHVASASASIAPGGEIVFSARYPITGDGVRSVSITMP
ncbi:hypothetical protein [Limoniibacter endophyticus]|uniref:hypothetical protein n=1 Tax=Limoniibacter endophyticus TaxID=1565040 RepID=UPI001674C110|nr:hypothetical protein [Limoniibacter endophyticus]